MAENLKKFFKKKKIELKFKKAGPGQRLCDETLKPISSKLAAQPTPRAEMSEESRAAAAAAMARLQIVSTPGSGFSSSSLYKQAKSEMKHELSTEQKTLGTSIEPAAEVDSERTTMLAAEGVYFKCPLLGPQVLSKNEWRNKIKEYLYEQLESEKGLTACLIIRNCNNNIDKVNACTETLCKYLQNIVNNSNEDKYKKIRLSNKVFQEKVENVEGAKEFLEAAGFQKETLTVKDRTEDFLVFSVERINNIDYLNVLIDGLENAERIDLELDRNVQVLQPSQAEKRTQLPDDFYRYTPEELKKEHLARQKSLESSLVLRTKAMRERQEQREMKKYRYSLIRIRFPDRIFLQGTFSVYEKLEDVVKFVEESLHVQCQFSLLVPDKGKSFESNEYHKTLMELRLVPAVVLIFRTDQSGAEIGSYLKPDLIALLQNL